jgi:pimeloyl-ACP methyl ester carboxylesterase
LAGDKVKKKVAFRWWLRTYLLALRRKAAALLHRGQDPYPLPPEGVCLSPSREHFTAYDNAPLALTWKRSGGAGAQAWQSLARTRLKELLGIHHWDRPPRAHHSEETELGGGLLRRRIYLRVTDGRDVPVFLIRREPLERPAPVLLYLAGSTSGVHVGWGEARIPADYLLLGVGADMARQAAARGYLVVCVEQACFGERMERSLSPRSDDRCVDAANHALLLGRCLLGEQVADMASVVDWLLRDESGFDPDPERLHLFGHSSGGTVAVYTAAVDTRIRAAFCSGCVGPIRKGLGRRRNPGGAAVVPGILNWLEMGDVVGLCAPRPFIGISGERDHIYPFHGVAEVIEEARSVYGAFGRGGRILAVAGPRGHQYYPAETWAAVDRMLPGQGKGRGH